jgi:hypothetical protein
MKTEEENTSLQTILGIMIHQFKWGGGPGLGFVANSVGDKLYAKLVSVVG